MQEWNSECQTSAWKLNLGLTESKDGVSANGLRTYVFWPDTQKACKKGIFLIPLFRYSVYFWDCQQNREKRLFASSYCPTLCCPSAFNIFFLVGIIFVNFSKSALKIQIVLKYDKRNCYFTWRPIHIYD
jgi:hypothetical protein